MAIVHFASLNDCDLIEVEFVTSHGRRFPARLLVDWSPIPMNRRGILRLPAAKNGRTMFPVGRAEEFVGICRCRNL